MTLKQLGLSLSALTLGLMAGCSNDNNNGGAASSAIAKHVLLISVDGMHQVDLQNWIAGNPT